MNIRLIIIFFFIFLSFIFIKRLRIDKSALQDERPIFVGTNAEFPPFSLYENDRIIGFDIDIMHEIARRLNRKIDIKDLPFDVLIPEIQLNRLDLVIGGLNPTPERAEKVFFTQPLYDQDMLAIFTPSSAPLESINQLANKSVLVNEGYFADLFLTSQSISMNLIRLSTNNILEGLSALSMQRGDAFVASVQTVVPFLSLEQKKKYHIALLHETREVDAFAVSKQNPELFVEINQILDMMKKDGTLNSYVKKWFHDDR